MRTQSEKIQECIDKIESLHEKAKSDAIKKYNDNSGPDKLPEDFFSTEFFIERVKRIVPKNYQEEVSINSSPLTINEEILNFFRVTKKPKKNTKLKPTAHINFDEIVNCINLHIFYSYIKEKLQTTKITLNAIEDPRSILLLPTHRKFIDDTLALEAATEYLASLQKETENRTTATYDQHLAAVGSVDDDHEHNQSILEQIFAICFKKQEVVCICQKTPKSSDQNMLSNILQFSQESLMNNYTTTVKKVDLLRALTDQREIGTWIHTPNLELGTQTAKAQLEDIKRREFFNITSDKLLAQAEKLLKQSDHLTDQTKFSGHSYDACGYRKAILILQMLNAVANERNPQKHTGIATQYEKIKFLGPKKGQLMTLKDHRHTFCLFALRQPKTARYLKGWHNANLDPPTQPASL